jgi:hypothetical protein
MKTPAVALIATGAFVTGLIVVQMVDEPSPSILFNVAPPGVSVEIGAWVGLLGALLIAIAGVMRRAPVPEDFGSP